MNGRRDGTKLNRTVRKGTRRKRIGCNGLGNGGKGRYGMGSNEIERRIWMGEHEKGPDATGGVEGRMTPLFFRIYIKK